MGAIKGLTDALIFCSNLLLPITGIVILSMSVLNSLDSLHVDEALRSTNIVGGVTLFIFLGGAICAVAFFGCCEPWKGTNWMLSAYILVVCMVVTLQIVVGVYVWMQMRNDEMLRNEIGRDLQIHFDLYYVDDKRRHGLDMIQQTMKCCGVRDKTDWIERYKQLPDSCCADQTSCTIENAFNDSCYVACFRGKDRLHGQ